MHRRHRRLTVLIDSNFILHQARTTLPDLSTEDGIKTGLLYGALARISSLMDRFETNRLMLCWDSPKSLRKEIYPQYKENRQKVSDVDKEERKKAMVQFPVIRKQLEKLGFPTFLAEGYEGDDLFAAFIQGYPDEEFIMVTADGDMYQLLERGRVSMFNPAAKESRGAKWLMEKYGVTPEQWGMVKAIGGCTSDNVQGLAGIGVTKAINYLLGTMPEHHKAYTTIKEGKKEIKLYKRLTILPFEGTPKVDLPDEIDISIKKFKKLCKKNELASFLAQIKTWERYFNDDFSRASSAQRPGGMGL